MNRMNIGNFMGFRPDANPETMPPNAATDVSNVEISRVPGEIRGGYGLSAISEEPETDPAYTVDGLHDYRKKTSGEHTLLAVADGKLWEVESAGDWTEVTDGSSDSLGGTSGKTPIAVTLQEHAFFANGTDAPWYYDGSDWGYWGSDAPARHEISDTIYPRLTDDASDATNLEPNATYWMFFTFYDSTTTKESPPSQIVRKNTATTPKQIEFQTGYCKTRNTGSYLEAPSWADTVRVWSTISDDPCGFYLADSVDFSGDGDDVHITSTIDLTDTTLAGNTAWDDFSGPPEKIKGVIKFGPEYNRLMVWGSPSYPSRIWWTAPDTPWRFTDANWASFGTDDGDEVQACVTASSTLVLVFKRNATWGLWGAGPSTFSKRRISDNVGCDARHSVVTYQGAVYWLSRSGAYRFSDGRVEPISEGRVRQWIGDLTWSDPDAFKGAAVPESDQIWWLLPDDNILVYDIRTGEFLKRVPPTDKEATAFTVQLDSGNLETVVALADTKVYKYDSSTFNWAGDAQALLWEGGWFPTGGAAIESEVFTVVDATNGGTLAVNLIGADHPDATGNSLAGASYTLDTSSADVRRMPYGAGKRLAKVKFSHTASGKTVGVRLVSIWTQEQGRRI